MAFYKLLCRCLDNFQAPEVTFTTATAGGSLLQGGGGRGPKRARLLHVKFSSSIIFNCRLFVKKLNSLSMARIFVVYFPNDNPPTLRAIERNKIAGDTDPKRLHLCQARTGGDGSKHYPAIVVKVERGTAILTSSLVTNDASIQSRFAAGKTAKEVNNAMEKDQLLQNKFSASGAKTWVGFASPLSLPNEATIFTSFVAFGRRNCKSRRASRKMRRNNGL